jgi:exodeoxyribonuclease V alpha subunit
VLQDLIESGVFRTVMLRKIFRQALESDIVANAHRILNGEMPQISNKSRDFFFLERDNAPVIYKHTVELMRDKLPGYVHCDPGEIQVLTPMRKGPLGVVRLNEVLQSVLNPPSPRKREVVRHEVTFREGDKVMQTRNNYQIEWEIRGNYGLKVDSGTGVFNGEIFAVHHAVGADLNIGKFRNKNIGGGGTCSRSGVDCAGGKLFRKLPENGCALLH